MPVLPPSRYDTLGVTHDHPLLDVKYSPEMRVFEVHLDGAYVLGENADSPECEYTDVRVRVEGWQDATFEASSAQRLTTEDDLLNPQDVPFDLSIERLAEVYDLDLTPDVRMSGWLVFAPEEVMRWYTITFEGAVVTVTYAQVNLLGARRSG